MKRLKYWVASGPWSADHEYVQSGKEREKRRLMIRIRTDGNGNQEWTYRMASLGRTAIKDA